MVENPSKDSQPQSNTSSNAARDHLANERTFLAWVRTGVAIVVFGFAIGRFAIAIRQWMQMQGRATLCHRPDFRCGSVQWRYLRACLFAWQGLFGTGGPANKLTLETFSPPVSSLTSSEL
jgi:uncharacterized protein DUF202